MLLRPDNLLRVDSGCCELIQGGQRVLKSFSKRWDAETASEDMMGITWSAGPGNSLVNMVS